MFIIAHAVIVCEHSWDAVSIYVLLPLVMLLSWFRENMSGAEGPWGMLRAPGLLSEFPSLVDAVRGAMHSWRHSYFVPFILLFASPSSINCSEDVTDNYTTKAEQFHALFLQHSRPLAQIVVLRVRVSRNLLPTLHTPQVQIHVSASQRREAECSTSRIRNGTYRVGRAGKQQQEQNSPPLSRALYTPRCEDGEVSARKDTLVQTPRERK